MIRWLALPCLVLSLACGEKASVTDAGGVVDGSRNDDATAATDANGRVDANDRVDAGPAMDGGVSDAAAGDVGGDDDVGVADSGPIAMDVGVADSGPIAMDVGVADSGVVVMDGGSVVDAGRRDSGEPFCDSTLSHLEHCVTFDNLASGLVVDHSMYARNGTVSPALRTTTAGYDGNGLSSTGAGEAYFGNVIAAPTSLTIEAWVNFNRPVGNWEVLVDKWTLTSTSGPGPRPGSRVSGYWLGSGNPGNRMEFYINNSVVHSGDLSARTGWVHVAGTWDGTTRIILLYIDGVVIGQGMSRGAIIPNRNGLRYANGPDPMNAGLDGLMDQVRIWSTVRTQAEICRDMGRTPGPNGTCLP